MSIDAASTGHVVAVRGAVVDVAFEAQTLPAMEETLLIAGDSAETLVAEVQSHLDAHTVRAIALQDTAGLVRGALVTATGASLTVPVGEAVLGRLLDVMGQRGANTIEVKREVQDAYNAEVQAAMIGKVWLANCTNYFRHPSGKVVTQLPFSGKTFAERTRDVKLEDYRLRR